MKLVANEIVRGRSESVTTRMTAMALLVSELSARGRFVKLVVNEIVRGQPESVLQQE